jgi:hypothetical protein
VPSPADIEKRAREFRAPDALDRRAGGEFLADPPNGVSLDRLPETVIAGQAHAQAPDPESFRSIRFVASLDAEARPGYDDSESAHLPEPQIRRTRPSRSALRP